MKWPDSLEEGLEQTEFFIGATDYERFMLWSENERREWCKWDSCSRGWIETIGFIGFLDEHPVAVSFSFARLNGHMVCFYEATSQIVDHAMVEKWFKDKGYQPKWDNGTRSAFTNPLNFHHCISHVNKE